MEEELNALNLAIVQKREEDALGHIEAALAKGVDSEGPLWTWAPLHSAIEHGQWRVVQALCDQGGANVRENLDLDLDIAAWTPLYHAAATGQAKAVEILLRAGAEVDVQDPNGRNPLHHAAQGGHADAIRELLRGRVKVDVQDPNGQTPLHHAAKGGHQGAIQALLEGRATVDVPDSDGRTPLHHAAQAGHVGAVQALLRGRAKVNAQDSDGRTPLHHADRGGHAAASIELRNSGANMTVFSPDFHARYPSFFRAQVSQPIPVQSADPEHANAAEAVTPGIVSPPQPQYQVLLDACTARDARQSSAGAAPRRHEKGGLSQ
ncbi:MAG: ankyrin repeat domain-containing protein [Hydrogenophaga sp.]|uniref:ankyrin repeat domain-containing protein n=1 Tax=Hydrogenophaga sp. TaxID=1904254 RepID=UPI003D0BA18E